MRTFVVTTMAAMLIAGATQTTSAALILPSEMHSGPYSFSLSGSDMVTLPKFDTQGGTRTLTGVKLTLDGGFSSSGNVTNENSADDNVRVTVTSTVNATGPSSLATSIGLMGQEGFFLVTPGQTRPWGAIEDDATDTDSILAGLAAFEAPGTIDIDVIGIGGILYEHAQDFSATDATTNTGIATIMYTFNEIVIPPQPAGPTPEPAAFALAGIGLLGLTLVGWRRRRRTN